MFHAVARMTNWSTTYAAVKKYSFGISWLAAAKATATASATTVNTRLLIFPSSSKQPGGPERQRREQQAEGHRRRPRRAEEGRSEGLGDAEHERADQRPPDRAHAAEHAHREHQSYVLAADRR